MRIPFKIDNLSIKMIVNEFINQFIVTDIDVHNRIVNFQFF